MKLFAIRTGKSFYPVFLFLLFFVATCASEAIDSEVYCAHPSGNWMQSMGSCPFYGYVLMLSEEKCHISGSLKGSTEISLNGTTATKTSIRMWNNDKTLECNGELSDQAFAHRIDLVCTLNDKMCTATFVPSCTDFSGTYQNIKGDCFAPNELLSVEVNTDSCSFKIKSKGIAGSIENNKIKFDLDEGINCTGFVDSYEISGSCSNSCIFKLEFQIK